MPPVPAPYFRWRLSPTFLAHLFKAVYQQHHEDLRPALSALIPADGTVIDVGAHAGQFAKLFASIARNGRVVALEPGTYARAILRVALWRNRIDNLLVLPCGAGDAPSVQLLTMPVKRKGSYGFGRSHLGTGGEQAAVQDAVVLTTIDTIVEALALTRLDFLKADIEGWELRMLEGARRSIARHRPAMMLELDPALLARAGDSMAAARRFLDEFGYERAAFVGGRFVRSDDESSEFWLPRDKLGA